MIEKNNAVLPEYTDDVLRSQIAAGNRVAGRLIGVPAEYRQGVMARAFSLAFHLNDFDGENVAVSSGFPLDTAYDQAISELRAQLRSEG